MNTDDRTWSDGVPGESQPAAANAKGGAGGGGRGRKPSDTRWKTKKQNKKKLTMLNHSMKPFNAGSPRLGSVEGDMSALHNAMDDQKITHPPTPDQSVRTLGGGAGGGAGGEAGGGAGGAEGGSKVKFAEAAQVEGGGGGEGGEGVGAPVVAAEGAG